MPNKLIFQGKIFNSKKKLIGFSEVSW